MAEFRLGRLKFNWTGNWTPSTAYVIDDIMRFGPNNYVCITNHTSTGIGTTAWASTDSAYWQLHVEGFTYKGGFATETSYVVNDVIKLGGNQYICTSNHVSVADTSSWASQNQSQYWSTYNENITPVDEWTPDTYYSVNQLITIGGNVYRCNTAHAGAANTSTWYSTDFNNWTIFNPGLDVVGAYTTSVQYGPNDVIKIGPKSYRVVTPFSASGTVEYGNLSVLADGVEHRGGWIATGIYYPGDLVEFNGNAYINISQSQNSQPNLNASDGFWNPVAVGMGTTAAVGTYSSTTIYNQSDMVTLGGNTYRVISGEVSGINPVGVGSDENWQLVNKGLNFAGTYNSGTTYELNDLVEYASSTYVSVASSNMSVTPGTDANYWAAFAIGDSTALLTTRGDILYRNASTPARLGIGSLGTVLTSDGTDVFWDYSGVQTKILYVDPVTGNDNETGTSAATAYRTLGVALTSATGPQAITNIAYNGVTGFATITIPSHGILFDGSRIRLDNVAFSTATLVTQVGFSSNIFPAVNGEQLGGRGGQGGGGSFFDVSSRVDDNTLIVNIGTAPVDIQYVEGGTVTDVSPAIFKLSAGDFFEQLPIRLNPNVSVVGDSLRGTTILPAAGLSTDGVTPNNRKTMFQLSDGCVLQGLSLKGMTGFTYNVDAPLQIDQTNIRVSSGSTACGVFCALNPDSPILRKSPYLKDCTCFSHAGVGVFIDGGIHTTGNKSMVFDSFTMINSDGAGYILDKDARAEIVSCFTYYCSWGYFAGEGARVRSVGGNNSYGDYAVIASGFSTSETARTASVYGGRFETIAGTVINGPLAVGLAMTGATSGAEATLLNDQTAGDYIIFKYDPGYGDPSLGLGSTTFVPGETVNIAGGRSVGIASVAGSVGGQKGVLIEVAGLTTAPRVGDNVAFTTSLVQSGVTTDNNYYIVAAVTGFTTATGRATLSIAPEKTLRTLDDETNSSLIEMRTNFSQMRLTGHDFLSVGTGNSVTTNYPNVDEDTVQQGNETNERLGGKVFFVSTDQGGNFRVGNFFSVDQLTGRATLDASAFNLSGLTELRLGAIGGQIGEAINEFSSDGTLSGNSNQACPTEQAVKTYVDTLSSGLNSTLVARSGSTMTGALELYADPGPGYAASMYAATRHYVDDQVGPSQYFSGSI